MRRANLWIVVGFLLPMLLFFVDLDGSKNHQLKKGVQVVRYLSAERQLKRSSFMVLKERKPSKFVDWLFSPLGIAEWPPWEDSHLEFDLDELKAMKKMGVPLIPKNLALVPLEVDPEKGRQIVVRADDQKRILIIEGFINPKDPPALKEEILFPKI
jgi:hypothetical protein